MHDRARLGRFFPLNLWLHCLMVNLFPMDKLHRAQIGWMLSTVASPPLLSGESWPAWKSNTLMVLLHQGMVHVAWNLGPTWMSQACSRTDLGTGIGLGLWPEIQN